ncbi:DNA polymerase IV [Priestia aryabhattai]|uniref:DNA polymerase IV n=1 Tax=Priestia aryabhattai TaxID=412384 RepID=A0AAX6NBL3_PRIAR|nr:DNA polymerase IV [Priestia aryabhattai]MDU9693291.1 DNA polymerase IV [Priestia aryabhattai]
MKSHYPKNGRVILHIDCNAYFASVEIANEPSLEGKPVVVSGNVKRNGMVIAANYVARGFGISTTMPLWEAKQKCPNLIVRQSQFDLYRETSSEIFQYLTSISPLMEPASIDEAYLDITDAWELGTPMEIAERIRTEILERFKIPVSIGISTCKVLSKMASDMQKPLGITVLRKRDLPSVIWPLPVNELHGCGKKTSEKMNSIGIYTIQDLAKADDYKLKTTLRKNGSLLKNWANGVDERPVDKDAAYDYKSIGNTTTLEKHSSEEITLVEVLERLSKSVSKRLSNKRVVGGTIQITIRYAEDFKTITRSRKLTNPTSDQKEILHYAILLFRKNWSGDVVRLLGISLHQIEQQKDSTKQLDLFSFEEDAAKYEKKEPLTKAIASLKEKFGDQTIRTGYDLLDNQRKDFKTGFNATDSGN